MTKWNGLGLKSGLIRNSKAEKLNLILCVLGCSAAHSALIVGLLLDIWSIPHEYPPQGESSLNWPQLIGNSPFPRIEQEPASCECVAEEGGWTEWSTFTAQHNAADDPVS